VLFRSVVFGYMVLKSGMSLLNNIGTFFFGLGNLNLKKYGSWVVVTGCTDGIGKAYAELLAKLGLNVVLISRSKDKLEEQAKYLKEKYSVQTKIIPADFTEATSIYAEIKAQISELDIALLFNNVGMSYKNPEFFVKWAENEKNVTDLINCNVVSLTKMSAIVLPGMVARKGGVIINNASASGRVPTPMLTTYSATKAYVDFFSRALNIEYKSKGIIVQSLCPYFVATKLAAVRKSLMAPTPSSFVSEAIKTIGTQQVTNGCMIHNIQGWLFENVIPRSVLDNLMMSNLLAARNRAHAKQKKLEATAAKKE